MSNTQSQTQAKAAMQPSFNPMQTGILQRKCACGQHTIAGEECEECRQKREGMMQRAAVSSAPVNTVPSIVHDVLGSPGQTLDASARAFMEPRFGHDFSQVRVHTNDKAAESARAVNALAYTVGRDVVFTQGQYAPWTTAGQRLLAHELTHVVQQMRPPSREITSSGMTAEMEAQQNSQRVIQGEITHIDTSVPSKVVQREADDNPLDEKAKAIIAKTKDKNVAIDKRAEEVVNSIIKTYYPSEETKVYRVTFNDKEAGTGLHTYQKGKGKEAQGEIYVGNYFVEHIDQFARRVLQVGHELRHIDQYKSGLLKGKKNTAKREFLDFHWEALVLLP